MVFRISWKCSGQSTYPEDEIVAAIGDVVEINFDKLNMEVAGRGKEKIYHYWKLHVKQHAMALAFVMDNDNTSQKI